MGNFHDEIPSFLIPWIQKQEVFWVATSPLSADGHVNVSTKGLKGTFHIIDSKRVWYEDLTGSGVETISHLRENGRITILFNAFVGPPRIARLFGKGSVYEFGTTEYNELLPPDVRNPGSRAVIIVDVEKVGTSCGYGVPFFEFKGHRDTYYNVASRFEQADFAAQQTDKMPEKPVNVDSLPQKGLRHYFLSHNATSIDGLTGLTTAHETPRACNIAITKRSEIGRLSTGIVTRIGIDSSVFKSIELLTYFPAMGQFFEEIPPFLISWLEKQQMFWTATAPLSGMGHVNLSPKCTRGMFHIVNSQRVWYEDMSGSGVETISHLKEPGNGRITILFHAFEGPPRICRLFGIGSVYEYGTPQYDEYISPGARVPGSRAVIVVDVHKVGTSCGYAIPFYEFKSHRNQLLQWAQKKESEDDEALRECNEPSSKGLISYWKEHNARSIDGIPGLDRKTFEEVLNLFNTGSLSYISDDATSTRKVGPLADGFKDNGINKQM
ncbi:pyridoxamine phosphate oxidase [Lentinula edodes]|uniref:Pyridoxamine phosphate oxidase n=1 Tax=Lentinula edodes TaxID=5353 RepID=A0A1Q3EL44_LENED|nr:pyridoxamine phosphate oxidase [Lentinula edodes]